PVGRAHRRRHRRVRRRRPAFLLRRSVARAGGVGADEGVLPRRRVRSRPRSPARIAAPARRRCPSGTPCGRIETMLDLVVRAGTLLDGTGGPPRTADVAVRDGRVVEVGKVTEPARRVIDADGALVTPRFVDITTHYARQ